MRAVKIKVGAVTHSTLNSSKEQQDKYIKIIHWKMKKKIYSFLAYLD